MAQESKTWLSLLEVTRTTAAMYRIPLAERQAEKMVDSALRRAKDASNDALIDAIECEFEALLGRPC